MTIMINEIGNASTSLGPLSITTLTPNHVTYETNSLSLFELGAGRRAMPDAFEGTVVWDLHLDILAGDDSGQLLNWRAFQQCFPAIISGLAKPSEKLWVSVRSVDPDYFDEASVIRDLLVPRQLDFVLLSNGDRRYQNDFKSPYGTLFFEWPVAECGHISTNWFMSPITTVEVYINPQISLGDLSRLYFDCAHRNVVPLLLQGVECAFQVWTDHNGLFLFSRHLSSETVRQRLSSASVASAVQEAAERWS